MSPELDLARYVTRFDQSGFWWVRKYPSREMAAAAVETWMDTDDDRFATLEEIVIASAAGALVDDVNLTNSNAHTSVLRVRDMANKPHWWRER